MSLDYLSKYLRQGSSSDKFGLLRFGLGLVCSIFWLEDTDSMINVVTKVFISYRIKFLCIIEANGSRCTVPNYLGTFYGPT